MLPDQLPMTIFIFRYTRPGSTNRMGLTVDHSLRPELKNLVICCDGTGNEISENISNVLELYRCLRKTEKTHPRQRMFSGIGAATG